MAGLQLPQPGSNAVFTQMASLLALVNDRITSLEGLAQQQQQTIMHLEYKLDSVQGTAARLPYLSGRFGYGLGRPAVKREVLLFAKQAQSRRERDDWPTVFLGKYRTGIDGARRRWCSAGLHRLCGLQLFALPPTSVPSSCTQRQRCVSKTFVTVVLRAGKLGPIEVPERIATTPGHYDIVALLPEDNTFARGSLFIMQPGCKCVLFDMDGTITVGDQEVRAWA